MSVKIGNKGALESRGHKRKPSDILFCLAKTYVRSDGCGEALVGRLHIVGFPSPSPLSSPSLPLPLGSVTRWLDCAAVVVYLHAINVHMESFKVVPRGFSSPRGSLPQSPS